MLTAGSVCCALGLFVCFLSVDKQDWVFNIAVYFFVAAFEMSHGPVW